jgi:hypothetical protein
MSYSNRPREHTIQNLSDKRSLRRVDNPEILVLVCRNTWLNFPEDRKFDLGKKHITLASERIWLSKVLV